MTTSDQDDLVRDELAESMVQMLTGVLCDKERAMLFVSMLAGAATNSADAEKAYFDEAIEDLVEMLMDYWEDGIERITGLKFDDAEPKGPATVLPFKG